MDRAEDLPLSAIEEFFAKRGFRPVVHQEPPPAPTKEELRRMSTVEKRARCNLHPVFWADLEGAGTESRVRWYGSGETEEAAVRSARRRWLTEEEGGSRSDQRELP
jgi:hypothetical protein